MLYRYLGLTTDTIDNNTLVYVKTDGECILIKGNEIVTNMSISFEQLEEVYDKVACMRFIDLILYCYNKSNN